MCHVNESWFPSTVVLNRQRTCAAALLLQTITSFHFCSYLKPQNQSDSSSPAAPAGAKYNWNNMNEVTGARIIRNLFPTQELNIRTSKLHHQINICFCLTIIHQMLIWFDKLLKGSRNAGTCVSSLIPFLITFSSCNCFWVCCRVSTRADDERSTCTRQTAGELWLTVSRLTAAAAFTDGGWFTSEIK